MERSSVSDKTWNRLQRRAEAEGVSVDVLLERLLDEAASPYDVDGVVDLASIYRRLLEASGDIVSLHQPDGRFLYIHPAGRFTGMNPDELKTMPVEALQALVHPDDLPRTRDEAHEQAKRGQRVSRLVYRVRQPDGSYHWVENDSLPIVDDAGQVVQIVAVTRPVPGRVALEETLAQREAMLTALIAQSNDAIAISDPDGVVITWNAACEALTGLSRDVVIGRRFLDVAPLMTPDSWHESYSGGVPGKEPLWLEKRIQRPDGSIAVTEMSLFQIQAGQGRYICAITRDVTQRQQTEQALRESEARYQSIVESQSDLVCRYNADLCLTYVNPAYADYFGCTPEDLIGTSFLDLIPPEEHDAVRAYYRSLIADPKVQAYEHRVLLPDGSVRWQSWVDYVVQDEKGGLVEVQAVGRDVTDRHRAEQALRESETRLRYLLNNTPAVIFTGRPTGDYGATFVSENVRQITGYAPQQFTSDASFWGSKIHPEDRDRVFQLMATIPYTGQSVQEYRYRMADGTYRWMRAEVQLVRDADGTPLELIGYWLDIDAERQAEAARRQSDLRLRSIMETQSTYVLRTDMNGDYTYVNPRFAQDFAWIYGSTQDFIGQPSLATIMPQDHDLTRETVMRCIAQPGVPVQVMLRKPSQTRPFQWTLWEFVALEDKGQPGEMQCVGLDISELMEAREQLQLQETALLAAANAIVITDHDANILWVNPAFSVLTGYSAAEALGKNPNALVKSGFHDTAFYAAMWQTILSGEPWQGKLINRRKDGRLYTEEQTITPVTDSDGVIRHFVAIKQDVTEREERERLLLDHERLKTRLAKEREHNGLIQRTVSALSHDLRTPLSVISSSRQMLSQYFDQFTEERRQEKLVVIERQLQFVLNLLDDLIHVVKGNLSEREFRPGWVDLPALCRASIEETRQAYATGDRFYFENPGAVGQVQVDETLVSRVLLNLLSNAVKYSPAESAIRLVLEREGDHLLIQVSDEGQGIDPEDVVHIFEPFYRTESAQQISGSGLGLSIVKDCVDRHQGQIEVSSTPGAGTTFTVRLPPVIA